MKKILAFTLFSLLFVGCDTKDTMQACTEEARSSVTLTIKNADTGDIVDAASVAFTINGANSTTISCNNDAMGIEYCGSLALTYEVTGLFSIDVSATGFQDEHTSTTITKDACHVIGKVLTIELQPI